MRGRLFIGVLLVYVILLAGTGYFTFVRFPGLQTLPSESLLERAAKDPYLRDQLTKDVEIARERREQLVKSASHSFDVVLGALLGFLSAVAATAGLTGNKREDDEPR